MADKSTSTSDPVTEDDHVQVLQRKLCTDRIVVFSMYLLTPMRCDELIAEVKSHTGTERESFFLNLTPRQTSAAQSSVLSHKHLSKPGFIWTVRTNAPNCLNEPWIDGTVVLLSLLLLCLELLSLPLLCCCST